MNLTFFSMDLQMERDGVKPLVNNIETDLKILQRRKLKHIEVRYIFILHEIKNVVSKS